MYRICIKDVYLYNKTKTNKYEQIKNLTGKKKRAIQSGKPKRKMVLVYYGRCFIINGFNRKSMTQEQKELKRYLRKWKYQKFWKEFICSLKGHTYQLYYTSKGSGHQLWYCSKCIKEKMI